MLSIYLAVHRLQFLEPEISGMATGTLEDHLVMDVADRQQIGAFFTYGAHSKAQAAELERGVLKLDPHPAWQGDLGRWDADPYKDRNWRFQRNSLRWVMPLIHASNRGSESARLLWQELALGWITSHQVPARRSSEVWYDMAVGLRAIVFSLGVRAIDSENLDMYVEELRRHQKWLMDEKNLSKQNHALHQHQGLFVLSALLADDEGQTIAISRMSELFFEAFDEEGLNDEGSSHYQKLNIGWWKQAWSRVSAESLQVPEGVKPRIKKAGEVLAHMTSPTGAVLQIGDGAEMRMGKGFDQHTDWSVSEGREGRRPAEDSRVLAGGFFFSRTGWDRRSSYYATRFGNIESQGHAHCDQAAVWYSARGIDWLVDSGFWSYERNDSRVDYLKGASAHNVSSLPGYPFDGSGDVTLDRHVVTPTYHDLILRDYRYQGVNLRRRIVFARPLELLAVIDTVSGIKQGEVLQQDWHLTDNVKVLAVNDGYKLSKQDEEIYMLWPTSSTKNDLIIASDGSLDAWLFPKWKTKIASTAIRSVTNGAPATAICLICPRSIEIESLKETRLGQFSLFLEQRSELWNLSVGDKVSLHKRRDK